MKKQLILGCLIMLMLPFSAMGQPCEKADAEIETAMSASTPSEQIAKLTDLLQRCPDNPKGLNNLGFILEEQGKLKDAIECYRRAIHADQRFPYPYVGLGDIYFQQKQYSLAAAMYNEVLMLYQSAAVQSQYADLKTSIPRIRDQFAKCQASLPAATRSMKVVSSDVIEAQLKEDSSELTRGIQYKPQSRPKIALSIHFDFNSAEISKSSYPQMEEIAKALAADSLKTCVISIEGHADAIGGEAYNQSLSEKRSASVKQFLANRYGIDVKRLKTAGYGKSRPVESNETEAGRAANRRVELVNAGVI